MLLRVEVVVEGRGQAVDRRTVGVRRPSLVCVWCRRVLRKWLNNFVRRGCSLVVIYGDGQQMNGRFVLDGSTSGSTHVMPVSAWRRH